MSITVLPDSPQAHLDALCRTRATLDGSPSVFWWVGEVFRNEPGAPYTHLFGFEGLNVGRVVDIPGGRALLSREAAFYLDRRSRAVLERWDNPWTGEEVRVDHVWNDPVNQRWLLENPWGPLRLPVTVLGDQVCFALEIPLEYPSPLPVAQFPDSSADDTYRALELFQFFTPMDRFAAADEASVPCTMSWMRSSPWLPWMRMGQRPGGLIFHCRAVKLDHVDELPQHLREHVAATRAEYLEPPDESSLATPNATSWTVFRDAMTP